MRGIDTPAELRAWLMKRGGARIVGHLPEDAPHVPALGGAPQDRRPWWPYKSRTEQRYALLLEQWQHEGLIVRWRYEAVRLLLAPATTLTVDFCLTMPDGRWQFHEVKGAYVREDGWIKLKQAAALWPEWRFALAQWKQEAWHWREVPSQ
jgi:hypothetical protein